MRRLIPAFFAATLVAATLSALTACESSGETMTKAQPAPMDTRETVIGEEYAEAEAAIQAIDRKNRDVTLRTTDGTRQVVKAPADVDLKKFKVGDVVVFGAYQKLSVRALPPGAAHLGVTRQVGTARSQPGETPGRAVGEQVTLVYEIAAIDVANNKVTLRGADGAIRSVDVKNPDNQRKLKTLKIGDLVQIELFEAVVVSLKPKA
jgi:hypothetical protein